MLWLTLWLLATTPPPEVAYLATSVTLNEPASEIASRFQQEPQGGRNSGLRILAFNTPPAGLPRPLHQDLHDSCDSVPAWSFQFRGGRLETVQVNLEHPVRLATALPQIDPVEIDLDSGGGTIRLAGWRLDADRVLVAAGVNSDRSAQAFLLLRTTTLEVLYPKLASALHQAAIR